MKYYIIYYNNDVLVTQSKEPFKDDREWLKSNYGRNAKGFREISLGEYIIYNILNKKC